MHCTRQYVGTLAIANDDLHKTEDPARGVDRAVVTLHSDALKPPDIITTCSNRRIRRLLRLVLGALAPPSSRFCRCNGNAARAVVSYAKV